METVSESGVPEPVAALSRPAITLGKYELVRRIAVGGMAELYLAKERSLHDFERMVVLKCILPQNADSPEFVDMLINEARLAALLVHPNLAQVYDIGIEDGRYFVVMEFVDGHDLRAVVRASNAGLPLQIEHVLTVVIGIASGLHHAHEATDSSGQPMGLVHRDVSPSNVLLTASGGVKLVDFGIAKAYALQPRTLVGALKGKVPYMSPEQCRSELLDRRSDIFSLGTLLWELSVGARLFRNANNLDTLQSIARGRVPRPSSIRRNYPRPLERIVMKALAPAVDDRYATAQELQLDLEDFAREHRIPVSTTRLGQYVASLFADSNGGEKDSTSPPRSQSSVPPPCPDAPTVAESQLTPEPTIASFATSPPRSPLVTAASVAAAGLLAWLALDPTSLSDEHETRSSLSESENSSVKNAAPLTQPAATAATPSRPTHALDDQTRRLISTPFPPAELNRSRPDLPAATTPPPGVDQSAEQAKNLEKVSAKPSAGKSRKKKKRKRSKKRRTRRNAESKRSKAKRMKGTTAWDPDSALPPPS